MASRCRPSFQTARLSLVDRGFVYAIAHIRGGTEKGWRWYRDGKLEHKTNTFTDFIAAGRASDRRGLSPAQGRIVAQGGSAGGMLMGAVANMRAGAVRRHHRRGAVRRRAQHHARRHPAADAAGMAGVGQSRSTTPRAFDTIRAYSPYDNVGAARLSGDAGRCRGLTDPRVTYWEPAKWVAQLRAATTSGRPILLRIEHGRRPRRRLRPLRPAEGDRLGLRLRAQGRRPRGCARRTRSGSAGLTALDALDMVAQRLDRGEADQPLRQVAPRSSRRRTACRPCRRSPRPSGSGSTPGRRMPAPRQQLPAARRVPPGRGPPEPAPGRAFPA